MKNVDAETMDRAALRADLRGLVGKLAEWYGIGLALLTLGACGGGAWSRGPRPVAAGGYAAPP